MFFSYMYCNTISFLLNLMFSHAVHANEKVPLTLDVFITSIIGIVIISILHWTIMNIMFNFFLFVFVFLMATQITLSLVWTALQNDNVSTLQRTKHLRGVPLTAGNDTFWICLKNENVFHKIVKSRWDKSYWQNSMRDQKQQSNRQWCKHRERVGLACSTSRTVLCLQLRWPMQSGMCQWFLV